MSVKKTPARKSAKDSVSIGCLISLVIRNQNAKPQHRQQNTELNVRELLQQLELREQLVGEHGGGEVGEHGGGEDWQHLHQQPSHSSSSEESFEDAQKNW